MVVLGGWHVVCGRGCVCQSCLTPEYGDAMMYHQRNLVKASWPFRAQQHESSEEDHRSVAGSGDINS